MLATIKLDSQLFLVAIEVENVSTDRMLPSEFRSRVTAVAQQSPQQRFRVRQFAPHFSRIRTEVIGQSGGMVRHSLIHA
ncbi:hypothetical protein [Sideroxydans lithotrophicus]|uniref:hypothetical protein n=1 Tax=Sideroxydans lithotrophicus TaxID=63745 RepID=UPI00059BEE76